MNATKKAVWMTRKCAALRLRVDPATVGRMLADGRLEGWAPLCAPGEKPPVMISGAMVDELVLARQRAGLQPRE